MTLKRPTTEAEWLELAEQVYAESSGLLADLDEYNNVIRERREMLESLLARREQELRDQLEALKVMQTVTVRNSSAVSRLALMARELIASRKELDGEGWNDDD